MTSSGLWIAAIAVALALLTALGCSTAQPSEAEQRQVAEVGQPSVIDGEIDREIDCGSERGIGLEHDPDHGPELRMLLHLSEAILAADDDLDSDGWRCELLAAAGYAGYVSKEGGGYYDGTIFAPELEAAAYARTWPEAWRELGEAWERALGPDGTERFIDSLKQSIAENRRLSEGYSRSDAGESD